MTPEFYGDVLVWVFAFGMLVYSLVWIFKHREHWFVAAPMAFYFLHALVFYGLIIYAIFLGIGISALFNHPGLSSQWSLILRLHSMTTMMFFLIIATQCIRNLPIWKP
jgi:hypothetical protein